MIIGKLNFLVLGSLICMFTSCRSDAQKKDQDMGQGPPSAESMLKMLDEDEDGKLSKEEVRGPLADNFDEIDLDSDGYLSKKELEEKPHPKPPKGDLREKHKKGKAHFEMMDENEDGKLSKEEVKGPLADNFEDLDIDNDGYLSREELKKMPRPKKPEGR